MSLKSYAIQLKRICKLGHVTLNGHFARKKLKLEKAQVYNSSQSKKLLPNMSLLCLTTKHLCLGFVEYFIERANKRIFVLMPSSLIKRFSNFVPV